MQPPTPADQQFVTQLADAIRQAATAQPSWLSYVPAISAVIATVSAAVSLWLTRSLAREARGFKLLPMIIFYRRAERVWTLKNVGEGTAASIVVRNYVSGDRVQDEVQLYPVVPGQEVRLDYLRGADKLIAGYVNILGQDPHLTICSKDTNDFKRGKLEEIEASVARGHESDIQKWPMSRL
jgi:hypothetical protein